MEQGRGSVEPGEGQTVVTEAVPSRSTAPRRLVITVCPREAGVVVLPVDRGGPARRLDAATVTQSLRHLVAARRLDGRVCLREGCAGGCGRTGPNVDVRIHPVPRPGEKPDDVAIGGKTYVYSLASLDCVATIIDENLGSAE
jgi:hypothetical protein